MNMVQVRGIVVKELIGIGTPREKLQILLKTHHFGKNYGRTFTLDIRTGHHPEDLVGRMVTVQGSVFANTFIVHNLTMSR